MLTRLELKKKLRTMNYTQAGFAKYIGVNPRTVRSWIGGRSPIPEHIPTMLELIQTVGRLKDQQINKKKPRK